MRTVRNVRESLKAETEEEVEVTEGEGEGRACNKTGKVWHVFMCVVWLCVSEKGKETEREQENQKKKRKSALP